MRFRNPLLSIVLMFLVIGVPACVPENETGPSSTATPISTPTATATPHAAPIPPAISEVQDDVPFEIVLPTYLPHGMQLRSANVHVPPQGLSEEGRRRNTKLELSFSNEDKSAGFMLYESIAGSGIGDAGTKAMTIGSIEGEIYEDKERGLTVLFWRGKEVAYHLLAFPPGKLTKDEVMRIAESIIAVDAPH